MGQRCVVKLLCFQSLSMIRKAFKESFEQQRRLKSVGDKDAILGFTAQLQPPITYVYTHEQMLVMLVNIACSPSMHLLLFKDQVLHVLCAPRVVAWLMRRATEADWQSWSVH